MQKKIAALIGVALLQLGTSADYDPDLALRLVNYASAAYCLGTGRVSAWSCSSCNNIPGFSEISQMFGSTHHGRAFVGYDHVLKARVVGFEGTHFDIHTVADDMNILPTACYSAKCPECKCHPGFYATYYEIADKVYRAVSLLPPGKLIITGHSLGASMATHCAVDMHNRGLIPDHVYTFGEPRNGNDGFATFYDNLKHDHWRVTHHEDPVPHLPWRGVGNYRHSLREAYYAGDNAGPATRVCSATDPEDPLCTDQFNDELSLLHVLDHELYVGHDMKTDLLECAIEKEALLV